MEYSCKSFEAHVLARALRAASERACLRRLLEDMCLQGPLGELQREHDCRVPGGCVPASAPRGAAEGSCLQGLPEHMCLQGFRGELLRKHACKGSRRTCACKGSYRPLDWVEGKVGGGHAPHVLSTEVQGAEGELEGVEPKCREYWPSSLGLRQPLVTDFFLTVLKPRR